MESYASLMKKVRSGDEDSYYEIKKMRADIFHNTVAMVNQGFYITETGRTIVFDTDRMLSGTQFYSQQFHVHDIPTIQGRTTVEVVDTDCLLEGIRLLDEGYRPAVLNMANRQRPGGGVRTGLQKNGYIPGNVPVCPLRRRLRHQEIKSPIPYGPELRRHLHPLGHRIPGG